MYRPGKSFFVFAKVADEAKEKLKIAIFFGPNCERRRTTKDVVSLILW
jgi:hypothetical protein